MLEMAKGANVGLNTLSEDVSSVVLSLAWRSATGDGDADAAVLLLSETGKVRADTDFFFYNNPASADGSVQLLGKTPTADGSEDRISLDLSAMPPDVERVVLTASRYGGARFGDLDELRITLADGSGEPLLTFPIGDAGTERAFIFGELYRRSDEWRFRAVGQGYESGLGGLATDFGIDVDDEPEESEASAGDTHDPQRPKDAEDTQDTQVAGDAQDSERADAPGSASGQARADNTERLEDTESTESSVGTGGSGTAVSTPAVKALRTPAAAPASAAGGKPAAPDAATAPAPRRPRTAKKKIVLPRASGKSLAENEAWHHARLFPVPSLRTDRERETRATSVLLSVMSQVPEFGRRLTAGFGAPAGRMESFTEVSLPRGDTPKRPDGVIRVERAGKLWTALVETKTNGNALKTAQVQDYMDIASKRGYEAVITLSNDVALDGTPLVDVKVDGRRKHKVGLWHLSWAEVTHQAQMLIRHEGVGNAAHAWLLLELLYYLQHENSGCHGFQNMGPAWVPVRKAIDDETLRQGDAQAAQVVESWERLVRQVCLRLGGELGNKVLPVQRARRGSAPHSRRAAAADRLCTDGRLSAELRVDGTPGILSIAADLRTFRLRTSIDMPAPEQGYPLTWAKRLIRQLADAPADLHVETLVESPGGGPRGTLERLRPEPADILPRDGGRITGVRLSLLKGMGNTRGNSESGFIRSVDEAVGRFYTGVVAHLERRPARRPQSTGSALG